MRDIEKRWDWEITRSVLTHFDLMIYENYSRASKCSHNLFSFLITPELGASKYSFHKDSVRVPPNTVRFGGSSEQVWFPD